MDRSASEFLIHSVQRRDDCIIVDGRCLRAPIRRGDVLSRVYELVPENEKDPYGASKVINDRAVKIRVLKMEAYRRDFEELFEGLTARMELSALEKLELKANDVLGV